MTDCRYTRAASLREAVDCLQQAGGEAQILAGGIALGILINQKLLEPTWLIDLSRLEELKGIHLNPDGSLRIGAMTTHHEIESSAEIAGAYPMLTEMAREIACGRIKNRGTIGGNICLADPQGDPPVAMIALRAKLRASGPSGPRDIVATAFYTDLYTTALAKDELLREIQVPAQPDNTGMAFGKFSARRAMDYSSTVSAAVRLVRDPASGRIIDIGIGIGGAGLTPIWAQSTESTLRDKRPDGATIAAMHDALQYEIEPIGDDLYSADYKRHVAAVILKRTLERAYAHAAEVGGAEKP
jgi:aerobic carbon-monoxide dehydrogenase medium subunit